MITQFKFKNFRSFKEETVINFTDKNKLIVIYGANASGKSNVFKAFEYFRNAVTVTQAVDNIVPSTTPGNVFSWTVGGQNNLIFRPFKLNKNSADSDTEFEISFDHENGKSYKYGFHVSFKNKIISSEYLYIKSRVEKNITEKLLFKRDLNNYEYGPQSNILDNISSNIRPDILALPYLVNNNQEDARVVYNFITSFVIQNMLNFEGGGGMVLKELEEDTSLKTKVLSAMSAADFFIKDLKIIKPTVDEFDSIKSLFPTKILNIDNFRGLKTIHQMYDNEKNALSDRFEEFDFKLDESTGTQAYTTLMIIIFNIIKYKNNLIFLDEANTALHPVLMKEIIKIIRKNNEVQVILCTHDTGLLSREVGLEKEAIFFIEKNNIEESEMYSLSKIEGVRVHSSDKTAIDKQYLEGRFGAVPYIVEQNYEI